MKTTTDHLTPLKPATNGAYVADYCENPTTQGNEGLVPLIPPLPHPHEEPMKTPTPAKKTLSLLSVLSVLAALTGISAGFYFFNHTSHPAPTSAAPPALQANVQTVAEQKVRIWNEFSGRLRAVDFAEIRPEVSGRITEIRFEDGQTVKAGDILFVIDPRPYEDAVAKAQARVSSAKAAIQFTQAEQKRAEVLIQAHAIAQRDFDQSASADRVASSALEAAVAELKQATLDLDHAYVKAPITGRISRAEITVGNVVQSGPTAPVLTSIASRDGIYADFEVDEQTYLETIRNAAAGNAQERLIPVQLVVPGDREHAYDGFIRSFDNRIDAYSGTIRARAKFDNADGALLPGMFITVRLASSREQTAILIPERAIGSDQNKKFVYVVSEGNKASYREIQLGKSINGQRLIASGLVTGDRVIVDGVQHARPGTLVQPSETKNTETPALAKIGAAQEQSQ